VSLLASVVAVPVLLVDVFTPVESVAVMLNAYVVEGVK
jgi:hypothetical protein